MRDLLLNWTFIIAIKFWIKSKSRLRKPALRLYWSVVGYAEGIPTKRNRNPKN